MSLLRENAISQLRVTLQGILDTALDDSLPAPSLMILPYRVHQSGIGGVIGMHDEPDGEVLGVTVNAKIIAHVQASSSSVVSAIIDSVSSVFQSLDRSEAFAAGIRRLEFNDTSVLTERRGSLMDREISFDILYEFQQLPTQSSDTISDILLQDDVGLGAQAKFLINETFESDPMAIFDSFDDSAATTNSPSSWQYNIDDSSIDQITRIRGGNMALTSYNKPGTYLVLNSVNDSQDFILNFNLLSNEIQGVGAVFRWQDDDNFYFFLMSNRDNYRIFGKKIAGIFSPLALGGEDITAGYDIENTLELKVIVVGNRMQALLDNELILNGEDSDLMLPGQVGFMTHGNSGAKFFNIKLTSFDNTN